MPHSTTPPDFFTSDLHFGHDAVLMSGRAFLDLLESDLPSAIHTSPEQYTEFRDGMLLACMRPRSASGNRLMHRGEQSSVSPWPVCTADMRMRARERSTVCSMCSVCRLRLPDRWTVQTPPRCDRDYGGCRRIDIAGGSSTSRRTFQAEADCAGARDGAGRRPLSHDTRTGTPIKTRGGVRVGHRQDTALRDSQRIPAARPGGIPMLDLRHWANVEWR